MSPDHDPTEKTVTAPIPQWPPTDSAIAESVAAAMQSGEWGKYQGTPIETFCAGFARWLSVDYVWPCASGTIAVELALRGCGVQPDDQVIMAGYDFPGNFRAVEAIGARPVLVDVVANGFLIDIDQIQSAVGEKTKALLVSHLHGQLVNMPNVVQICKHQGLSLVEDACQVPGALVAGKLAGTHGDVGAFSFGGSKLLTAGRGGAVICNHESTLQRIRISAERGNDAYPLSALQAAALVPQIEMLAEYNAARLRNARLFHEALRDSRVFHAFRPRQDALWKSAFYKYPLLVKQGFDREAIINGLKKKGVPVDSGFRGFTKRSKRRCDRIGELTNSSIAANQTILLHHPVLLGSEELARQIIEAIIEIEKCTAG